ncbi:uncharacterized protein METZ01_LOCUS352632, partial [marine metagenome]
VKILYSRKKLFQRYEISVPVYCEAIWSYIIRFGNKYINYTAGHGHPAVIAAVEE